MNTSFLKVYIFLVLTFPVLLFGQPDTAIHIKAIPGMQYDQVRIQIPPGYEVKLTLSNVDDMSHNLVVTKPEARIMVVEAGMALAERGPELNFIPEIPEVLWSIPVLSPGEEGSLTFTVPDSETILPFVCTFPGHGFMMYGAFYVTNGELPRLETDDHVPEHRRKDKNSSGDMVNHVMEKPHPYSLDPPYYYRIFMPHASPASIAVRLTDEISYCWDAGPCQLLYAWRGGFIDNSIAWGGHRNTEARILGTLFYTEKSQNPICFGAKNNKPDQIQFQGYRLEDRNPEFHYLIDGIDIYETFQVSKSNGSLIRKFRIPDAPDGVWLAVDASVRSSRGVISDGYLKLTPEEAKQFSIQIPIHQAK